MNRLSALFFSLSTLFFFMSCSSKLTVSAIDNNSAFFELEGDLGEVITEMIKTATLGISEINGDEPLLFDKQQMEAALKKSDIQHGTVEVISQSKVRITGIIPLEKNSTSLFYIENNEIEINATGETIRTFANSFGEELTAYLDLLMAPVFTGDNMTKEEYCDLVKMVYGKELCSDIKISKVVIITKNPDGIKKEISIPLLDLLTQP